MKATDLALLGGTPTVDEALPGGPFLDHSELASVQRVLKSGNLSGFVGSPGEHHFGGPEVRALEEQWSSLGDYAGVVAVNSATAGLHAGLEAMELPEGSEVIVPPYTMSATAAAVRMARLRVRFADVDPEVFTLTAETVTRALTDKTRAILVVHLFGQMAPMAELRELAERKGLLILEDAAQVPGATHHRVWPGHHTIGAVFSLNQNKTITCGEGGLVASNDERVLDIARLVRNHAESVIGAYPDVTNKQLIGCNYRITEVDAAIAAAQTRKLQFLTEWRVTLAQQLTSELSGIPGLTTPVVLEGNEHVYFVYPVLFDSEEWGVDRRVLVKALVAEGVPCIEGYVPPLYRLPLFEDARRSPENDFPACENLSSERLILITSCRWPVTKAQNDKVASAIAKCWDKRDRLRTKTAVS